MTVRDLRSRTADLAWISHAPDDRSGGRPRERRTIRGNLALVAFVAAFDENKNTARDEHP
jgi:hypothetical protein